MGVAVRACEDSEVVPTLVQCTDQSRGVRFESTGEGSRRSRTVIGPITARRSDVVLSGMAVEYPSERRFDEYSVDDLRTGWTPRRSETVKDVEQPANQFRDESMATRSVHRGRQRDRPGCAAGRERARRRSASFGPSRGDMPWPAWAVRGSVWTSCSPQARSCGTISTSAHPAAAASATTLFPRSPVGPLRSRSPTSSTQPRYGYYRCPGRCGRAPANHTARPAAATIPVRSHVVSAPPPAPHSTTMSSLPGVSCASRVRTRRCVVHDEAGVHGLLPDPCRGRTAFELSRKRCNEPSSAANAASCAGSDRLPRWAHHDGRNANNRHISVASTDTSTTAQPPPEDQAAVGDCC